MASRARTPQAQLREALPSLRRTVAFLRPHVRPHRRFVAGGLLALFGEVVFRLLEPWPLKFVLDAVIGPEAAAQPGIWRLLIMCAIATVLIVGMRALSAYLMTVCFAVAGTRAMTAVRAAVFSHVLRLSVRFHSRARSGDLITRLVADVGKLRDVAVTAAMPLLGNVVTLLAMVGVMIVLDWRLALVVVAAFPFFAVASSSSSKKITAAARIQRRREGDLAGTAGESLGAIKVVQAYSLHDRLEGAFAASAKKELKEGVKATRLAAGLERKTDLLVGAATAAVLLLGGHSVLEGRITPGELVVFVQYLKGAFKPMRDLAKYTGRIAKAAASGERIMSILETDHDVKDEPGAYRIRRLAGELRFEDVSVVYEESTHALRGLDLRVRAGSRVAIVGPSGSGKSTMAALLLRLQDPSTGRVSIDGHDLREVTLESLREHVGVVLQESVLFTGTVRENIEMGRPGATAEEIERAAREANAHEFIAALPQGYETVVGERGDTLSGGQRQRIAIARTVLRDPSVLILDEATAGLDPRSSTAVVEALERLTRGRTTVIITHTMSDVSGCDDVVVLREGQMIERGRPEDLLADDSSHLARMDPSRRAVTVVPGPAGHDPGTPDPAAPVPEHQRPDGPLPARHPSHQKEGRDARDEDPRRADAG